MLFEVLHDYPVARFETLIALIYHPLHSIITHALYSLNFRLSIGLISPISARRTTRTDITDE